MNVSCSLGVCGTYESRGLYLDESQEICPCSKYLHRVEQNSSISQAGNNIVDLKSFHCSSHHLNLKVVLPIGWSCKDGLIEHASRNIDIGVERKRLGGYLLI